MSKETYENDSSDNMFQPSTVASSANLSDESSAVFQAQARGPTKEASVQDDFKTAARPRIFQSYRKESETNRNASTSSLASIMETQTEWSWLSDVRMLEKLKQDIGLLEEPDADDKSQFLEDDANESRLVSPSPSPTLESVGPPKILQYQPESKKIELMAPEPDDRVELIEDINQFFSEFNVHLKGGHVCEFCSQVTLPWPSIQQQESQAPENLYCCNDYREFVEAIVEIQTEKERPNRIISINKKDDKKKQSKKARRLAKERQEQRNIERQLAKQKRLEEMERQSVSIRDGSNSASTSKNGAGGGEGSVFYESSSLNRSSKVNNSATHKEHDSQQYHHRSHVTFSEPPMFPYSDNSLASKQIRSINYQLSNMKYMQEGWTVKPDSGVDDFDNISSDEDDDDDVIVPATLSNQTLKFMEKPLTFKYYKNGDVCMIIFPDGTGSVFYPSGRLAISISLVSRGMHILSAFSDDEVNPIQLAVFDPFGNVCCNYLSGKIRLQMCATGGLELESDGTRKKRWLWWDPNNHVHAPPYQPIIFALNPQIYVKVYSQQKIYVNFYADLLTCKFRVGSKLIVAKPDDLPAALKPDPHDVYLKNKKSRTEELLKQIRMQLLHPPIIHTPRSSNDSKLLRIREKTDSKLKKTYAFDSRSVSTVQVFALTQPSKESGLTSSTKTAATTTASTSRTSSKKGGFKQTSKSLIVP